MLCCLSVLFKLCLLVCVCVCVAVELYCCCVTLLNIGRFERATGGSGPRTGDSSFEYSLKIIAIIIEVILAIKKQY